MIKLNKSIILIISTILLVFTLSACRNKTENTIGKAADNKNVVEDQTKPAPAEEDEVSNKDGKAGDEKVEGKSEVVDDVKQEEEAKFPDEVAENLTEETTENKGEVKNENTTDSEITGEEEKSVETETKSRDDSFYVEAVVDNFSKLYPTVVNREDAKFDVLDTVIIKDSKFYKELKVEVKKLKESNSKIEFEEFYIEGIKEEANGIYNVTVTQMLSKNTTNGVEVKAFYKVSVKGNKVGIVEKN